MTVLITLKSTRYPIIFNEEKTIVHRKINTNNYTFSNNDLEYVLEHIKLNASNINEVKITPVQIYNPSYNIWFDQKMSILD